jgi:hypothetical protein
LVTDLLDAQAYPALDLARAYPMRWECETVIKHHKTDLGPGMPVLRSKDPERRQEMWALFLPSTDPPDRRGRRCHWPRSASPMPWPPRRTPSGRFPPAELELAVAVFFLKILDLATRVRVRPDRASPRRTKKAGKFPARKPGDPSVHRRIQLLLLTPARSS